MRTPTRLAAAVSALLVTVTLSATSAEAAGPATAYQRQAFVATNHQRVRHDRVELTKRACLTRLAVHQAKRMAARERIFHQDLGPVLRSCGLSMAGENVASGFRTGRSVVDDGWMHSSGHRANILEPRYRLMGIGARRGDDGAWYVSQVFGRAA